MNTPIILTHRGLDPDRHTYWSESTKEAFIDQLQRGYGLEFDFHFTKDRCMPVLHDATLKRITNGVDLRSIDEVNYNDLQCSLRVNGTIITLSDLLILIEQLQSPYVCSALHLKHEHQNRQDLDALLRQIAQFDHARFIIFDATPPAAAHLKQSNQTLQIYASVAHLYDIKRYNHYVGGTLISLDQLEMNRSLYTGAWLDEWDLTDENGNKKTLYNKSTFDRLRARGFGVALVTPELHCTSPGLLGGESHPSAAHRDALNKRLVEIVGLKPDIICTDHPDHIRSLLKI